MRPSRRERAFEVRAGHDWVRGQSNASVQLTALAPARRVAGTGLQARPGHRQHTSRYPYPAGRAAIGSGGADGEGSKATTARKAPRAGFDGQIRAAGRRTRAGPAPARMRGRAWTGSPSSSKRTEWQLGADEAADASFLLRRPSRGRERTRGDRGHDRTGEGVRRRHRQGKLLMEREGTLKSESGRGAGREADARMCAALHGPRALLSHPATLASHGRLRTHASTRDGISGGLVRRRLMMIFARAAIRRVPGQIQRRSPSDATTDARSITLLVFPSRSSSPLARPYLDTPFPQPACTALRASSVQARRAAAPPLSTSLASLVRRLLAAADDPAHRKRDASIYRHCS